MKRILWFRRDLRLQDNPLLAFEGEVLPIFIFDTHLLSGLPTNDRRVTFIYEAVMRLKKELQAIGLDLKIFYGKPEDVFDILLKKPYDEVVATGDYDAYARQRDLNISLKTEFRYLHDTYIFKPDEVLKDDGTPYLVFTPFYKKAQKILETKKLDSYALGSALLIPYSYDHITDVKANAQISEKALCLETLGFQPQELHFLNPCKQLEGFLQKIDSYDKERDFLNSDATSHLSVHLRFGTLGIRELLRSLFEHHHKTIEPFIRQLIFRDFYAYLLYHFPFIETRNYKYHFNGIQNQQYYERFCQAQTGVPIIDAAVTQLITTGQMHNRARMIVASFFTKDLLLPWQWGEAFFAQHLLDYDKASNVLSWQWSAGTGIDPQPYFRVFNPYLQSKKFDKEALYIKKYLPQLQDINPKHLHDESYLCEHQLSHYPQPMLNHKTAAQKAIEFFKNPLMNRQK